MHEPGIRLSERDRAMLAFAAEHRLVLREQLEALTRAGISKRMRALADAGYLEEGRNLPLRYYRILKPGLIAIDSTLRQPESKVAAYKHDIGLAWLWLGAHRGAFGSLQRVLSERRLRSEDGALEHPPNPHGVRTGGLSRHGNATLHYPDLLLVDHHGRRLALELELTSKGRGRLQSILAAYGSDRRIDRVLYLAEDNAQGKRIGRAVATTVREMGLSGLVCVQRIRPIRISVQPPRPALARRRPPPARAGCPATRQANADRRTLDR